MGIRAGIYLPLAFGVALFALAMLLAWQGAAGWAVVTFAVAGAAAGVLAVWQTEMRLVRPLQQIAARIAQVRGVRANAGPDATVAALPSGVDEIAARLEEQAQRTACDERTIAGLREELRGAETQLGFVVERAEDGAWEWNIESGAVLFSPRWSGMLGYRNGDLGRIEAWRQLIHPDDREAVLMRLHNHLEGLTPAFEAEQRLRMSDGGYRWIHSRGMAIRHASGRPYRLVMMDKDIDDRKRLEDTLVRAAEGLSAVSGVEFFRELIRHLSEILGTRDNLVCYVVGDPPTRACTLAYLTRGEFTENFEYELAGTSCGAVIARREIVYCPTGVCEIWPEERQYDRDSYIGVPMFDSGGRIIGHFACMDGAPMRQNLPHLAIFKIFSVRAAAELERTLLQQRLAAR